ncbi:hypothetical protein HOY80DRAFT_1104888 [Tuber brumale]|nr:hypothetical protein HOY80DRAFT_1104888 [Tuber brumale]
MPVVAGVVFFTTTEQEFSSVAIVVNGRLSLTNPRCSGSQVLVQPLEYNSGKLQTPSLVGAFATEEYVRLILEQYGDYLPAGLLEKGGVGAEEGGGRGEGLRADGSPLVFRTHPLTYVGQLAASQTRLPPLARDQTESVIADARKRRKHQLTIPLNPINSRLSGIYPDVLLARGMGGCMFSGWGEPGVYNVLDRSVIEAEEEGWKDSFSERTGKPPPGPDGKALTAWERSRLWAVVAGLIALGEKVSKLLNYTLFIAQAPDIYFENAHHTRGALTEKNKTQPREHYDLIIDTNRLRPIVKSFYSRQVTEKFWGTPMGFEAIAHARPIILKQCIKEVGEAPQSLPTTNAHGSANAVIEKGPGAIIAPCTGHEECPLFVSCPTDGTRRKEYCSFSKLYELIEEPFKNHEDLEYPYVAFRREQPAIDNFGVTPADGEPDMRIQSPYTASQLRNYSLTLPRIILPPTKRNGNSLGEKEFRDARKSGLGDLRPLGTKSRTSRKIEIGDGNQRFKSKLIAIMDFHDDGAWTVVNDKTTAFLRARKKDETKEAKKVARLQRKLEARYRHAAKVSQHEVEKERKLQEEAMAEREQQDAQGDGSGA